MIHPEVQEILDVLREVRAAGHMNPDVREVLHELRHIAAALARTNEQGEPMTKALNDAMAAFNLAVQQFDGTKVTIQEALDDVKAKVGDFVSSIPGIIAAAIDSSANDSEAVAAIQAATTKLAADGADLATSVSTSAAAITAELVVPAPPVPPPPPPTGTPAIPPPAPDAPPAAAS